MICDAFWSTKGKKPRVTSVRFEAPNGATLPEILARCAQAKTPRYGAAAHTPESIAVCCAEITEVQTDGGIWQRPDGLRFGLKTGERPVFASWAELEIRWRAEDEASRPANDTPPPSFPRRRMVQMCLLTWGDLKPQAERRILITPWPYARTPEPHAMPKAARLLGPKANKRKKDARPRGVQKRAKVSAAQADYRRRHGWKPDCRVCAGKGPCRWCHDGEAIFHCADCREVLPLCACFGAMRESPGERARIAADLLLEDAHPRARAHNRKHFGPPALEIDAAE